MGLTDRASKIWTYQIFGREAVLQHEFIDLGDGCRLLGIFVAFSIGKEGGSPGHQFLVALIAQRLLFGFRWRGGICS